MDEDRARKMESMKEALLHAGRKRRPSREFQEFLNGLDLMGVHIALYLVVELKINVEAVPKLVPLIDPRCFEERLKLDVDDLLRKFEEDLGRGGKEPKP